MRLFIPGPVNVEEDVLKVMSSPMISHRSKSASCLQQSISENMQILWNTKNSLYYCPPLQEVDLWRRL